MAVSPARWNTRFRRLQRLPELLAQHCATAGLVEKAIKYWYDILRGSTDDAHKLFHKIADIGLDAGEEWMPP